MRRFLTLLTVLMLSGVFAFAQNRTVSGTVKDETGAPVPFATVTETGTRNATTADANGAFSINRKGNGTLTFTAAGFSETAMTPTGGKATVVLSRKVNELSTVVITTALGIKRQARGLGYATAQIPPAELTAAKATNIANGLSGKVSGLQVNTVNNGVSADTRIVLRGERSILGNNQALIVLDNIPVSADYINSLNPNDVESVTILKGANAAALYGADASNGVIMITRKKGTNAKPSVTFTHTTTLEKVGYFPKLNTRFGAASTEPDSLNPYTGFYGRIPYENQMYGPEYNGNRVNLGYEKQLVRADGTVYDTTNSTIYNYKNPLKNFFQTGITNQDGVSYQAGNEKGSYFFSGQVNNTTGTIPQDKATRYSLTVGGSTTYNKFTSNFSVGYTKFVTDVAGVDYSQGRPVYWNVLNTPGEVDLKSFKDLNAPFANENDWYNAYYPNPYWQINNSRVKTFRDDIIGSLELGFKATSWLNFTYRIGAVASNSQQKNTKAGVTFSEYEISDPFGTGGTAGSNPNGVRPRVYDKQNQQFIIQSDFLVTLQHKIANDLNATLILGNSINKAKANRFEAGEGVNGGTGELEIPGLYNQSNLISPATVFQKDSIVGKIGAFGSLQLAYKNFLFLEVTGRNDWVSLLAPENRSYFFPGVNASFVFTDAIPSLKNISWLSFGKLTGSLTKVGNVSNVQPYSLSNTFSQILGFPYSVTSFSVGDRLANNDIKPEFIKSRELGLQLSMFKSHVNLGVTYYDQDVSNQTVPIQISSASGYTSTLKNVGNVSNSGWEFDLRATPLVNLGPVKWNVGGNLALYHSYVDEIDPQSESIFIGGYTTGAGIYTIKGQPMRVLQVKDWKRDSITGKVIVDPRTGRPSASTGVVNLGNTLPKVIMGLSTSFDYKNFSLSVLAEYRGGYVVYNNVGNATAFTGVSEVTTLTGRQRFVYPNSVVLQDGKYVDNTNVVVDNASNGSSFWASTFRNAGTPFVTSGDYWKIREVSITYDFKVKNNKIIKKASVGLVGRNLFTFLPKDNVYADPEYSTLGTGNAQGVSDENLSPPTRVFGATITVGF
ncbi:MAG: SusC/RagA family TonB-linked outer membrane protein [Ginsengibacter sp.]